MSYFLIHIERERHSYTQIGANVYEEYVFCYHLNRMGYHLNFLISYFLLLILAGLRGGEAREEKCVERERKLLTLLKNESGNFHDYFGKPVILEGDLDPDSRNTRIFHFQMIDKTNYIYSSLEPTDKGKPFCCQWNSEGCYVYVWFKEFYYLLISPTAFIALNQHYSEDLPLSICISVPSVYRQDIHDVFEDKVIISAA